MDPTAGSCTGGNYAKREQSKKSEDLERWLTEQQIASPQHMNSADHARIMIKCLPKRPHENPMLRAEGIMQYKYTESTIARANLILSGASVEQTDDVSGADFLAVKIGMCKPLAPLSSPGPGPGLGFRGPGRGPSLGHLCEPR